MTIALVILTSVILAAVTRLRRRWTVLAGSLFAGLAMIAVGILAWFAATPCGASGNGILAPTPQCSVQATHVVSFGLGLTCVISLFTGALYGVAYAAEGEERSRRVFQIALLAAALIILVWLACDVTLPRTPASD